MSRRLPAIVLLALTVSVTTIDCEKKAMKLKEKRDQHRERNEAQKRLLLATNSCDNNEFACSFTKCISLDQVCDTHKDCLLGNDEANCPTDCTGQNQFKCENSNKCIGVIDKCDGHPDCSDYSDEAFCEDFECPAGRFRCVSSNVCIQKYYVCDGMVDCEDGSDEMHCFSGTCASSQWMCADNERCLPRSYVCDGQSDCLDHSDEIGCTCADNHFKCQNGDCVPSDYKCDGDNDCGDRSDELDCPALPSNVCEDLMTYADCFHMNETTHPICLFYVDGDKFCRKFCGFCV